MNQYSYSEMTKTDTKLILLRSQSLVMLTENHSSTKKNILMNFPSSAGTNDLRAKCNIQIRRVRKDRLSEETYTVMLDKHCMTMIMILFRYISISVEIQGGKSSCFYKDIVLLR